jgi:hypothetical protein
MITSVDTQDWTENQIHNRLRNGDFEYSIDGTYFQDSIFEHRQWSIRCMERQNGCATVTDEVYLLMYPKFFSPNGDGFKTLGKSNFQIMKLG